MKKRNKVIAGFAAILLLGAGALMGFNSIVNEHPAYATPKGIVGSDAELRGVWIPTVHNLAYPSKVGLSSDQLKAEADKILNNSKDLGFNVVFFQVRPGSDAFYKSDIFPWSRLISGTQGVAPSGGFDPLQYFIDGAHARGMELHAWVNPYRVTTSEAEKGSLAANNPAVIYPELTVNHSDGKMYFNPGEPQARQLVIDGVSEIVDKYDVDGIHFDDYFYPGKDFKDENTFAKYGSGYANISDFRRGNNDKLIQEIKSMIGSKGKNIAFGVSPFGIWANKSNLANGSNTNGSESYFSHYADTRKWVKEGYIDYIMPQLYWEIGHTVANYDTLAKWWSNVVSGTNTKLYIGMGPYKTIGAAANSPWVDGKEITKQLAFNKTLPNIKGNAMYAYQSIAQNKTLYDVIKKGYAASGGQTTPPATGETVNAVITDIKVSIDGSLVNVSSYNINGNNYFKLRDIAFAVKDSQKKFEVTWDQEKQAINMEKGKSYTIVGGEMNVNPNAKDTIGTSSTAEIYLDGIKIQVAAYTISDNNYFKLRDLGEKFDFATEWDNDNRIIYIKTNENYTPE